MDRTDIMIACLMFSQAVTTAVLMAHIKSTERLWRLLPKIITVARTNEDLARRLNTMSDRVINLFNRRNQHNDN